MGGGPVGPPRFIRTETPTTFNGITLLSIRRKQGQIAWCKVPLHVLANQNIFCDFPCAVSPRDLLVYASGPYRPPHKEK